MLQDVCGDNCPLPQRRTRLGTVTRMWGFVALSFCVHQSSLFVYYRANGNAIIMSSAYEANTNYHGKHG